MAEVIIQTLHLFKISSIDCFDDIFFFNVDSKQHFDQYHHVKYFLKFKNKI